MLQIQANALDHRALNEKIRAAHDDCLITGCLGQRFIADGLEQQTTSRIAEASDLAKLRPVITRFCALFDYDAAALLADPYTIITPDSRNPYQQLYVAN